MKKEPRIRLKSEVKELVNEPKVEKYKAVEKRKKGEYGVKTKGTRSVKALKYMGATTAIFQNPLTGKTETIDTAFMKFESRDFDFDKIFGLYICNAMGILGGAKIQALIWLIKNRNRENIVNATTDEISNEIEISAKTIKETIRLLRQFDFMKKIRNGCYQFNPDVIFKGNHAKRMSILLDYEKIDDRTQEQDLNTGGTLPEFKQEFKHIDKKLEDDLFIKKAERTNLKIELDSLKVDNYENELDFMDDILKYKRAIRDLEDEIEKLEFAKTYLKNKNPF